MVVLNLKAKKVVDRLEGFLICCFDSHSAARG